MDFLALTNALRIEAGISGPVYTDVVGAVAGSEHERVVGWIKQAWRDIENAHSDWLWLRASATVQTVAGDDTYTTTDLGVAATFSEWLRDTFRVYLTSLGRVDEGHLEYLPYDEWRDYYNFGAQADLTGRPVNFSIAPNNDIVLGPDPDAIYTVTGDYLKMSTALVNSADVPAAPQQFHDAIVYRALMYHALYESAPEVLARGKADFNRWMSRLEAHSLPQVAFAPPLVA